MSLAVDPESGPTSQFEERPSESPEPSVGARESGECTAAEAQAFRRRIEAAIAALLDRNGENVPIRPAHVRYPKPPRLASVVAVKAAFAVIMGVVLGCAVATQLVAAVGHGASVLGQALTPGIYFPTDFLGWLHLDGTNLTRDEVTSLNAARVSPAELHGAFANGINAIGAGAAVGVALAIAAATRPQRIPREIAGLKGTAEWASYADVKRAGLVWDGETPGVYLGEFERPPLFGLFPRAPVPLVYCGPRHILQNAPSRSGKDVGTNTYTAIVTWH